ncbi:MAG TPA: hypothetical protein VFM05_08680 [Candidatus Saccharimonadales bacterium]|nr:hypothetical protein [Candidatus Saccharimonadales bacterium]
MSVLVVSGSAHGDEAVLCVICLQHVPLVEVTAGSLYADGHQAFACNKHLYDRTRWISEWAAFDARQRQEAYIEEAP